MTDALASICAEIGIAVIPVTKHRDLMETCAVNTLERILRDHGPEHLRSVLLSIVETTNNKRQLIAPIIWGVSDFLIAHPTWFGSKFLEQMDAVDLGALHDRAKANRRAAQPRYAISTMLYERMASHFEPEQEARLI